MRLTVLIALRILSIVLILIALLAVGKLAMGVHAVFVVQQEFAGVNPLKLGYLHGQFIDAPFLLAAFFATVCQAATRLVDLYVRAIRIDNALDWLRSDFQTKNA